VKVGILFLFDKYYSNHGLTRLKNSSRDLQANCAISFYFRL